MDAVTVKGNRGLLREESRRLPKVFDLWEYLGDLEATFMLGSVLLIKFRGLIRGF